MGRLNARLVNHNKKPQNNYMKERVLGYILLTSGILVMAFSVYFVYLVVSNRITPFTVFQTKQPVSSETKTITQDQLSDPRAIAAMQQQIITEVLDSQINKTMNLGTTLVFTYFLMLFGFRIGSLGVQLMRPIEVKLNKIESSIDNQLANPPKKLA